MRKYWAHEPEFSFDNFGCQPTWLILQALEYGAKLHAEELHLQELGISTLISVFVNANRSPKSKPAKPTDFCYFKPTEISAKIPTQAADTFFELVKEGLLPGWAVGIAPIDNLRAAQKHKAVLRPRAWIGEGVLLVQPRLHANRVKVQFALIDCERSQIEVEDVDSGLRFRVDLGSKVGRRWMLDAEFDLT